MCAQNALLAETPALASVRINREGPQTCGEGAVMAPPCPGLLCGEVATEQGPCPRVPLTPSYSLPSLILPQGADRKETVQSAGKALFRKILVILIVKARQCNAGRVANNLPILI